MAKKITDKQRLDWLESQTRGYGQWTCRNSTTSRGYRLIESKWIEDELDGYGTTPREAIDMAIRKTEKE